MTGGRTGPVLVLVLGLLVAFWVLVERPTTSVDPANDDVRPIGVVEDSPGVATAIPLDPVSTTESSPSRTLLPVVDLAVDDEGCPFCAADREWSRDALRKWLRTILLSSDPDGVRGFVVRLEGRCEHLGGSEREVVAVLLQLRNKDPDWCGRFQTAFLAHGIAGPRRPRQLIRLGGLLAKGGDEDVGRMVDDCALGAGGEATPDQMELCAVYAAQARANPDDRLAFLMQVWGSPHLSDHPRVAGVLSRLLLEKASWPAGSPSLALGIVDDMLGDQALRVDGAAHLWGNFSATPPAGMDPVGWSAVWRRVTDLATSRGWDG